MGRAFAAPSSNPVRADWTSFEVSTGFSCLPCALGGTAAMTAASTKALQIAIVFFMGLLRGTSRLGPSFIILRWQIERNRSTRLSGDAIYEAGTHESGPVELGQPQQKPGSPGSSKWPRSQALTITCWAIHR